MTTKELVENLKQNMPQGLSEIEIARYIYIEIGKTKSFDTRHYYGNTKTKKQIYSLARKTKNNTDEVADKREIVCVSLSYLYKAILEEFGIKCRIALDEDDPEKHTQPIVQLSDGRELEADLQLDLYRIQTGAKTKYFNITDADRYPEKQISGQELKAIDQKIGYIEDDYANKDLQQIKEQIENMDANQMLEAILSTPTIYKKPNLVGHIEVKKYYYSLLNILASKYFGKKIYMFDCYRKNEDNSRDYTLCMFSHEKETPKIYMYSSKEKRFLPTGMEDMLKLQKEGLVLGRYKGQNGVRLLEKYITEYTKNAQKKGDRELC